MCPEFSSKLCYYGVTLGVEQDSPMCVYVGVSVFEWMHGQMDGWKDGVSVCLRERGEGWVGHLILCSKKQRCSLQMSAAFSGAQIKKSSEAR